MEMIFETGAVLISKMVRESVPFDDIASCLKRHTQADWGIVGAGQYMLNEAILEGEDYGQIVSAYEILGKEVWVVTEENYHETHIIFREEYDGLAD